MSTAKVVAISPLSAQEIGIKAGYNLLKMIGKGSFGQVMLAQNKFEQVVAIKLERKGITYKQLHHEYKIYELLKGGNGIPNVHRFGTTFEYNYMVMDLLGPTLESLFNFCNRCFSVETTCMVADQMLRLVEYVHNKKLLHRDIKPENFVVGLHEYNKLYLIDFGLSKRFMDDNGEHVESMTGCSFIGTARYASINSQRRITQSRRDDLESIGYVLIYFLKGALPWQNKRIIAKDAKRRKELILEKKMETPLSQLCTGLPVEFQWYMRHCRERRFDEKPNYPYLRHLFSSLLERINGGNNNSEFDWITRSREEQQPLPPIV